jgi:hypothetical protein
MALHKRPAEVTPAGRELMLKLQKLKPPFSKPSYQEIAAKTGYSVGTVHSILRKGSFSKSSFDAIQAVLDVLREPADEYLKLWNQIHEQEIDSKVIVTHPHNNSGVGPQQIRREALQSAAAIYHGCGVSGEQVVGLAVEFEDYLSGKYFSN